MLKKIVFFSLLILPTPTKVWICETQISKKFHLQENCKEIEKCAKPKLILLEKAQKLGFNPCIICYF